MRGELIAISKEKKRKVHDFFISMTSQPNEWNMGFEFLMSNITLGGDQNKPNNQTFIQPCNRIRFPLTLKIVLYYVKCSMITKLDFKQIQKHLIQNQPDHLIII